MVPEDNESLQKLLGSSKIPANIVEEYDLRLGLWHRVGGTGALGPMALVDLVRFCGHRGRVMEEESSYVDWRRVPSGTHVLYEDKGVEREGVYQGLLTWGALAIMPTGGDHVLEVPKVRVRVAPEKSEPVENVEPSAEVDWKKMEIDTPCWVLVDQVTRDAKFKGVRKGKIRVEIEGKVSEHDVANCHA